jgi:hypothetical protein
MSEEKKGLSTVAIVLIVLGVLLVLGLGTCVGGVYWAKSKVEKELADGGGVTLVAPPDVKEALAGPKKDYVGSWKSKRGSTLDIAETGEMRLNVDEGGGKETLTAPIARFKGDDMEVHMIVTVTIAVAKPPHQEGGTWRMRAKGIDFERVGP